MMHAIARRTEHAGRTNLTITSTHGDHAEARRAYRRIAAFFDTLRSIARCNSRLFTCSTSARRPLGNSRFQDYR